MKSLLIALVIAFCSVCYCTPGGKYTTKYDGIDLDAVIRNDRLLRNYVDCILGKRKCTTDGAALKSHIPDALLNDCLQCSEFQRTGSRKVLTHLMKNKRDWFNELEAKYDNNKIFRKKYEEDIKRAGVIL